MLRRFLAVVLVLCLPLANASAALMGPNAHRSSPDGGTVSHTVAGDPAGHGVAGDPRGHDVMRGGQVDAPATDSGPGCQTCVHCDFCSGVLGAPPASAPSSGLAVLPGRFPPADRDFRSAVLEILRPPPLA